MTNSSNYSTTDTATAAWLISQDFKLLKMDNSNPNSVVFLFENGGKELTTSAQQFRLGIANGNVPRFYKTYRELLAMIREQ